VRPLFPVNTASRLSALQATKELSLYRARDLRSLMPYFDEVALPAGSEVAVEGRSCTEFVVVLEGSLKACTNGGGCRVLHSGDSIGWHAMWERELNEATVVVEERARLLVMSHAQFRALKSVASTPVANPRFDPLQALKQMLAA
jgi:CRP-like cAMP-binding protein